MVTLTINKLIGGSINIITKYTGPLCFTAQENNATVGMTVPGTTSITASLQISTDEQNTWTQWDGSVVTLNKDEKLYVKALNPNTNGFNTEGFVENHKFVINGGKVAASGNIQYLIDPTGERMDVPAYCYYAIFDECESLTSAPELPATTLATSCYSYMFNGCASLTTAPKLPATNLAGYCYSAMFQGCTSLTSAPELPATKLNTSCYDSMFRECTALKRIKMNASSGNWGSYMFYGCTSLELVDMTGSTGVPTLSNVNNFKNTNDTYKIVVPDSLYDKWIAATNWASIATHIMKKSDWNAAHPDDILGQ